MFAMLVRCDKSGLGVGQTKRIARLLNPDKVMIIDSTPFNGSEQYTNWYKDYESVTINGFPSDSDIVGFLKDVKVILTCESWYSNEFVTIARRMGVKTIQIVNWEFYDNLRNPFLDRADKLISPSHWFPNEAREFGFHYLPTPIFEDEFKQAREVNLKRIGKRRYLFMNGKTAAHDRNGLESLYEALHLSKGDYEIVIRAQGDVKRHPDPRITYDFSNPENQEELYTDFDAMILPRRYAGQSLPMTEALQSGLPVIMTAIEPNTKVLPAEWLVTSEKTDQFRARIMIDVYSANPALLANKLDNLDISKSSKEKAIELGKQYDAETLRPEYERLISSLQ